MVINFWNAKVLQRQRIVKYALKKILKPILSHLHSSDHGKILAIGFFFQRLLPCVFPFFVSSVIILCIFQQIFFFYLIISYAVILNISNYWIVNEEIDTFEIKFLCSRFLPYQSIHSRRKTYFVLILQPTFLSYFIYILNWIIAGVVGKSWLYTIFGITITVLDPLLQFKFLSSKYPILKAFVRDDLKFLRRKNNDLYQPFCQNIFARALHRMIQPHKKYFLYPACILLFIFLGVLYFFKDSILPSKNIFIIYYYSVFPSFYFIFVKWFVEDGKFFSLSEITNYYYMKRFGERVTFIKQFFLVIFKNTYPVAIISTLPIYFFAPFLLALLLSSLYMLALTFIVKFIVIQKTAMLNYSLEEIHNEYCISIMNSLEQIEDFLVVNHAVVSGSFILCFSVKYKMSFLIYLFLIAYFIVIVFYTYFKGMVINARNKRVD